MAVADAAGFPLALHVASASPHEVILVEDTLDRTFTNELPSRLIGDKACDSDKIEARLEEAWGIEIIAPNRKKQAKTQDGRPLRRYRRRWKVEQLFAWLHNFRRLVVRYELHAEKTFCNGATGLYHDFTQHEMTFKSCYTKKGIPMHIFLRKLRNKIAPKIIFDRTKIDEEKNHLITVCDDLSNCLASVLNERNIFAERLGEPSRAVDWNRWGICPNIMYFKGYGIPTDLVHMTGAGPESFEGIASEHQKIIEKNIGIEPHYTFLEVGCGIGRDAIPLTERLTEGRYYGIDIIRPSIEWCSRNITPRHPNFTFHHFDIKDQLHNPQGTQRAQAFTFPPSDASVDRIIFFSVFTHMYADDIVHYLRECARVLKPGGLIYATMFIYSNAILRKVHEDSSIAANLRFEHSLNSDCRVSDPNHPLGAIAYTQQAINNFVKQSGLKFIKILTGGWSGYYSSPGQNGQDAMVLTKQ